MLANTSKNASKNVMPTNATASSARLVATKIESMSSCGSPRQNANAVSSVSAAAMKYFSEVGGMRIALSATSASVASASTSTPGMLASTGVGLVSLVPAAV